MRRFYRHRRMFMYFNWPRLKINPVFIFILIVAIVTYSTVVIVEAKITPIVKTIATSKAQQIGTRAVYSAISEVLDNENISYNNLIYFEKDTDGRINALRTNIQQINKLKSLISVLAQEKLSQVDSSQISIPIGNIINGELLSGRGPKIPIKLIPVGAVGVEVRNEFTSAGINQTRHQIIMDVTMYVSVILPGKNVSTTVTASMSIAETIIVGGVPQTYTYVTGDNSSTLEKINNYVRN